jgi:hypothetical protein
MVPEPDPASNPNSEVPYGSVSKFPVAPTTSDPAAYAAYKRDYEEYSSWYEKV